MPSAIAVIALSERGTMFDPGPCVYMEKLAGGPRIADLLDLDRPLGETVRLRGGRKGTAGHDGVGGGLGRPRRGGGGRGGWRAGGGRRAVPARGGVGGPRAGRAG